MSDSHYAYMTTNDRAKIRIGFWSAPDNTFKSMRQNIILLTGRASFMETYHEVIQKLVSQNFNVWSFDWRGQGLSSRVLNNSFKSHIDSYETYLKDLDQFINQIVQPSTNEIYMVMAQSMGAHLILRYLQDYKSDFSGVMLISPMLDILTGQYPRFFVELFTDFCVNFGWSEHYVLGNQHHDVTLESYENNYYTQNFAGFQKLLDLQKKYPTALVGKPTYGWLQATLKSIKLLLDADKLSKIEIPLYFIESGQDRVVDNRLIPYVMKFLKLSFHKIYPQARHQIFLETDEIIQEFWQDFRQFADYVDTVKKASFYKKQMQSVPVIIQQPRFVGMVPRTIS